MNGFVDRCVRGIGSRTLFWILVALFVVSALWVSWSARAYLVYDEYYHFSIIEVYSHQVSPFINQGNRYAVLGDLDRFSSFLYHWLLSWPDRWLRDLGADSYHRLIALRTISVAMSAASLYWFRRILLDVGVSSAVANTAVGVYVAIPLTSQIAATVNYDNLLQLLAAIHFSIGVRIVMSRRSSIARCVAFISSGVFGCLTQYEFLPVFAASFVIVLVLFIVRSRGVQPREWFAPLGVSRAVRTRLVIACVVAAIGLVVFVDRYVGNIILYHSPQPDCLLIHPKSFCEQYPPAGRNYALDAAHPDTPFTISGALSYFTLMWVPGMIRTMTLVGMDGGGKSNGAAITTNILLFGGAIALVVFIAAIGYIVRKPGLLFIAGTAVAFSIFLFYTDLNAYLRYGLAVAVQARYYLMFLITMLGAVGYGFQVIITRLYPRRIKLIGLVIFVLLVLAATQGGGPLTYMAFSTPSWFTPEAPLSHLVNIARVVANKIIAG